MRLVPGLMQPNKAKRRNRSTGSDTMLPIIIVAAAIIVSFIQPQFASVDNLINLSRQMMPLLILAMGQTFAIISGGLDLSIAAVMSLSGVVGVLVMGAYGPVVGVIVMLLVGIIMGSISGLIIAWFRASPLVVTLGMLSVAQGLALIMSGGLPIYDVNQVYADAVGFGSWLMVPITVWIGIFCAIVSALVLKHTVFGRYVYAIGSSLSAASKSGINVRLNTVMVYAASGLCAAIGGVVLTAWVGSAQPVAAPNLTLESLAAVVLGGVALTGGSGKVRQVIYGVIVLSMLSNVMNMIGVSAYYQTLAIGIVIILAVVLDRIRTKN